MGSKFGDMIAAVEIAMPVAYWHHDDFLFDTQFPPSREVLKDSRKSSAGDELLERFSRRLIRLRISFTPPQSQPSNSQPGVVGISYYPEIVRTFQAVRRDYLAKPPRPQGH